MIRQILGLFANILASKDKYPFLNREKLMVVTQMKFSQKQKTFSGFFFAYLKCRLNLEYFFKKDDHHRFCISEIRTPKSWLDKYFKSPLSEHCWTSNMVNGTNKVEIFITSPLSYFLTTVKSIDLEKLSLSDTAILSTVC